MVRGGRALLGVPRWVPPAEPPGAVAGEPGAVRWCQRAACRGASFPRKAMLRFLPCPTPTAAAPGGAGSPSPRAGCPSATCSPEDAGNVPAVPAQQPPARLAHPTPGHTSGTPAVPCSRRGTPHARGLSPVSQQPSPDQPLPSQGVQPPRYQGRGLTPQGRAVSRRLHVPAAPPALPAALSPVSPPLSPKAVPTLMAPLNKPRTGQQPGGTAWRCQRVCAGTCPRTEEPECPVRGQGPSPLAPLAPPAPLRAALSPLCSTG